MPPPDADSPNAAARPFRRPQPVPIIRLEPNPFQPRLAIDPHALEPLTASIAEFGFMGHVEARPHPGDATRLQIVFGHRRVRAAELAGLSTVPVAVVPRTEDEMRRASYIENVTQEPLTYWEEGQYFRRMQDELFLSIAELGALCGKSKGYVQNRLDVLRLPEGSALREAAQGDEVTMTAALALLGMDRPEQEALFDRLQAGEITSDDLKALRKARNHPLPEPVIRGETVAEAWTAEDHARQVLRLLEDGLPRVEHHARQANFGRLTTDELRRVRETRDRLRGLVP
jgi:ParB family chromosome partitioning protein